MSDYSEIIKRNNERGAREAKAHQERISHWRQQILSDPTLEPDTLRAAADGLRRLSQDFLKIPPPQDIHEIEHACLSLLCDAIKAGAFRGPGWLLWRTRLADRPHILNAAIFAQQYKNIAIAIAPGHHGTSLVVIRLADLIESFLAEPDSATTSPLIVAVPEGKWRSRPFDPSCTILVDPDQGLIDAMRNVVPDWNDNWDTVEALLRQIGYSPEVFPTLTIGVIRQAIILHRKPLTIDLGGKTYTNTPDIAIAGFTDPVDPVPNDQPIPLTALQRHTLDIIKDQPLGSTISGRQIVRILQTKYKIITAENTLTTHVIPAIKPLGVMSRRRHGYWFVDPPK